MIKKPTHILKNSRSCIDLILTCQPKTAIGSGVYASLYLIFHYQIIYTKFNLKIFYLPPHESTAWDFKACQLWSYLKRNWHLCLGICTKLSVAIIISSIIIIIIIVLFVFSFSFFFVWFVVLAIVGLFVDACFQVCVVVATVLACFFCFFSRLLVFFYKSAVFIATGAGTGSSYNPLLVSKLNFLILEFYINL